MIQDGKEIWTGAHHISSLSCDEIFIVKEFKTEKAAIKFSKRVRPQNGNKVIVRKNNISRFGFILKQNQPIYQICVMDN